MAIVIFAALAFVALVVVVGSVFTAGRTIQVFRDVRSLLGALGSGLEAISERLARLEETAGRAGEQAAALQPSLERLGSSRARLRVLTSALGRVRDQLTSVTAVYPRK